MTASVERVAEGGGGVRAAEGGGAGIEIPALGAGNVFIGTGADGRGAGAAGTVVSAVGDGKGRIFVGVDGSGAGKFGAASAFHDTRRAAPTKSAAQQIFESLEIDR